ncbi:MAG TPA: MarR family transcriptional regulator [Thermoleophilaceae bacterium]|nr:MarR family transcriptional regulator [Thermoleophilaceae bacterium]
MERLLASHDPPLTVAQYLALRAIGAEPLSAAELARRTGVSGPAVSQLVSALESAGLVSRGAPLTDPRTRELALKPAGKRLLQSATALLGDRLEELLDLPRPEADALMRSLERVDAALTGTAPPRRPPPPKPPRPRPR